MNYKHLNEPSSLCSDYAVQYNTRGVAGNISREGPSTCAQHCDLNVNQGTIIWAANSWRITERKQNILLRATCVSLTFCSKHILNYLIIYVTCLV